MAQFKIHVRSIPLRINYTREFNSLKSLNQFRRRLQIDDYYISQDNEPILIFDNTIVKLSTGALKVRELQNLVLNFNKF